MCNDGNLSHIMSALAKLINPKKCSSSKEPLKNLKIVKSCCPEYFCLCEDLILAVSEAKGFSASHCDCWVSRLF